MKNNSYIFDYERALHYNATQADVQGLLKGLQETHRHPADNLSPHRAAASDALAETGRDKEAGYLADPNQHVMILPHPDTKQLEVHPAKFDIGLGNNWQAENSPLQEHYLGASNALDELDSHRGNFQEELLGVFPHEAHHFHQEFASQYDGMSPRQKREHAAPTGYRHDPNALLPQLALNHHRVVYHNVNDDYTNPIDYRYEDVHTSELPNHLVNYLIREADNSGYYDNPEDTEHNNDNDLSNAAHFHRSITALRNAPVERRLTTSELNKLHESQET